RRSIFDDQKKRIIDSRNSCVEFIPIFFVKSNQKMVDYLRSSVGIKHKNHAEKLEDDCVSIVPQKKRLTFCVEGNIRVGKTTFLQRIANETLDLQALVEIVPEPIDKCQDIGPNHFNILDAFYAEPERRSQLDLGFLRSCPSETVCLIIRQ
ncbi:hypothetical protein M8C21_025433, partial [Ambrosia artemisiifolia]